MSSPQSLSTVEKWFVRMLKKAPYYLVSTGDAYLLPDYKIYRVIYWDLGKVKLADFRDPMYTRYGPDVLATMSSSKPTGLWQQRKEGITDQEYILMKRVYSGTCKNLPLFDLNTLRKKARE